MHALALVQMIERAFSERPPPLRSEILSNPPGAHLEADQVADFFSGKPWVSIGLAVLQHDYRGDSSACLSFMNSIGFRYYLPAFMLIAVRAYSVADTCRDSAINELIPLAGYESWWMERVGGFTEQEKEAITQFLNFMQEFHGDDYPSRGPTEALQALKVAWKSG